MKILDPVQQIIWLSSQRVLTSYLNSDTKKENFSENVGRIIHLSHEKEDLMKHISKVHYMELTTDWKIKD